MHIRYTSPLIYCRARGKDQSNVVTHSRNARTTEGFNITSYEIMLVINADAAEERQQELLERVQELLRADGGIIYHLNDWGRRKIAFEMDKHSHGRYVVITCETSAGAVLEMQRVLSISRDVALRHTTVKLSRIEAERAISQGSPKPSDDRPEGDRPRGGGGRGGGRSRSRR